MASFLDKLKAAVSIGNANSFSHPNAKTPPKPAPKPQPRVNAQQLARAMQGPALNIQNIRQPAPRPVAPPRVAHPNFLSADHSQGVANLARDFLQGTAQGVIKLGQLNPHTPQVVHPNGAIQQALLGKKPILSPYKQFTADKAKHGTIAAGALFPIGLALDAPGLPGKKQVAKEAGKVAKGIKVGKNVNKSELTHTVRTFDAKGNLQTKTVKGKPIDVHPSVETFIHRDSLYPDVWNISEKSTGAKIASGRTQKEALDNTKKALEAHPDFQNTLKNLQDKLGVSPKPNKPNVPEVLTKEAQKHTSVEDFVNSPAGKRLFKQHLNDSNAGIPFVGRNSATGKALGQRTRPYGDYVYNQDREMFNAQMRDFHNQVTQPTQGAIKRTELTGKALSTPSKDLGQATRSADTAIPKIEPAQTVKPSDIPNTKISSMPSSPISKADWGSIMQQVDHEAPHVATHVAETLKKPGYDVTKKASILDYLRTPANVLNKMGIGHVAKDLQAAEHQYKTTLPNEIDKITQWRKEVKNDPAASQRIFQHLDGNKGVVLSPAEAKVAGEMKAGLANWADRLNLPKEARLSNYITHIFEDSLLKKEFDPDLEKIIAEKTPRSVYDPFTQQRLGAKGYVEDAFRAMEAYVKRGSRKEAFDPALAKLESASQDLDLQSQKFIKHYADRINMRPTDLDKLIDNQLKQAVGYKFGNRPVTAISRAIRQATYRASLGLNVGSAVRNLTQGINTFAELGSRWTAVGYSRAVKEIVSHGDELKRVGVLDNSFVEDRVMSAFKQGLQKADKGLFALFDFAEKMNRGAAYFGAKSKAIKDGKTLEEAIQAGVDAARKTQFTFGRVDTPVALQSDIVKTLTQFQSYNVKQAEFLAGLVKNKEFMKLARFAGASAAVYFSVGKALGYKPSDMIPSFGIGQTPAFKIPGDSVNAVEKHNKKAIMKLGGDVGSASVPGFSQVKKTVTGLTAFNRAPEQFKTTGNKIKAAIFGQSSIKSGVKQVKATTPQPGDSYKKQVQKGTPQPQTGIYKVKAKDGSTKFTTLQGQNLKSYKTLDEAKIAQAKNKFKFSSQKTTTINGQQYHKTASGSIVKGPLPPPKAPSMTETKYDAASNTWTETNKSTGKVTLIASDGTRTVAKKGLGTITNARSDYVTHIHNIAPKYNLDVPAVMAVAAAEGLGGGVGDGGTSFGPFQLHVGGALPPGKGQAWAESQAGIDYALQQIAKVAAGKTGPEAVAAIVSQFERPADPQGEFQRAMAIYGGQSATLASGSPKTYKIAAAKGYKAPPTEPGHNKNGTLKLGKLPTASIRLSKSKIKTYKFRRTVAPKVKLGHKPKKVKV